MLCGMVSLCVMHKRFLLYSMAIHIPQKDLETLLLDSKIIDGPAYEKAVVDAKRENQNLVDYLTAQGIVTAEYITDLFAGYFKVPKIDLQGTQIPAEILTLLPEAYAKQHQTVVFGIEHDDDGREFVDIAMGDPGDLETISYLETKLQRPVRVSITTPANIRLALRGYRFGISAELTEDIKRKLEELRQLGQEDDLSELASAVPVVWMIERIIEQASSLEASDIHFEPFEEIFLIRFRIDGILREALVLPPNVAPIFAARIKILTNLKIDEHMAPQDGRFGYEIEEEHLDVRVSVVPVFWGEKVVMRLLRSSTRPTTLTALGLREEDRQKLESEMERSHGMILVTGPTGSGKSTSLYAMLQLLNKPEVNISTIEDPVEYTITRVNQTQVNVQAKMTFALGLRAFLRQDPNIIMVGEIRDEETQELAIHGALTGHLMLSTLHTNDAPTSIPRILDLGAQPFLLASTLNVVVAQRLVRRICDRCIASRPPTASEKKALTVQLKKLKLTDRIEQPKYLFHGAGCEVCSGTGYRGRIGIFEILPITDPIRELILQQAPVNLIRDQALADGFTTMFEDGMEKVEKGVSTLEEIFRVVRE